VDFLKQLLDKSFMLEAEKMPTKPAPFKPRTKNLNDALLSRRGGVPASEKTDYSRSKAKQSAEKEIKEAVQEDAPGSKYFQYTVWKDKANIGRGYAKAADVVAARRQALLKHAGATKAEAQEITKDQYYTHQNNTVQQ
jgi:hypothetical protein